MRVLILGEHAPGGLMGSYARGFVELGATVRTYCLAQAYQAVMPALRVPALRRVAEPVLLAKFNERVVSDHRDVETDLVVVLKGHRLSPATVDALRDTADAPVVNFYPDDPFSVERSNRLAFGPSVLAAYDTCFTFAQHLVPVYERIGARATYYLPFARDPALHAPAPAAARREFDIVFVGNLDDHRVRCMEAIPQGYRIGVFGERTRAAVPRGSPLASATFGPAAYGLDLSRTLARGAISLNVMRAQNARSHNMRSFESPACAAFTLSQRTEELGALFTEGEEVACFGTIEEMCDQIARWLRDDAGRRRIARAGYERVRGETYTRRAATMLERAGITVETGP